MTSRELHPAVERRTCIGANDVELFADAHGDPTHPAAPLLHVGAPTRHSWGGAAATLSAARFDAVAADLRGHGESGWDPSGDYTLAAHMGDIERWCIQLHRPAIVGASLGGMAALWTEGTRAGRGLEPAGSCLVLVDIAHRADADGVARIRAFMHGNPEGFASGDEAADAVADYLPHRPRPADTTGLARNLRLGDDGRYRWHWDPRSMGGDGPRRGIETDVFETF